MSDLAEILVGRCWQCSRWTPGPGVGAPSCCSLIHPSASQPALRADRESASHWSLERDEVGRFACFLSGSLQLPCLRANGWQLAAS